jgi:hypothetical protein
MATDNISNQFCEEQQYFSFLMIWYEYFQGLFSGDRNTAKLYAT